MIVVVVVAESYSFLIRITIDVLEPFPQHPVDEEAQAFVQKFIWSRLAFCCRASFIAPGACKATHFHIL